MHTAYSVLPPYHGAANFDSRRRSQRRRQLQRRLAIRLRTKDFEGLAALKRALPDMIISDLQMPNMNGFEFLSVVRQRFPAVPVIVISGEFSGVSVPESVLADAFFPKGSYKPADLFEKISELLTELPKRSVTSRPKRAAVGQER